ncbi:hypothetical protein PIB30_018957 [Stylosanthes scabra]|uniref:Ribonuclease H1 N-terminal domain-containing protein n=1 Tax=Stylosanthes scabra TaxID=79078 RepID=A0ABU6Z8K2_9FABA|nr:hypothetical protein [Stylosanthes scabra]
MGGEVALSISVFVRGDRGGWKFGETSGGEAASQFFRPVFGRAMSEGKYAYYAVREGRELGIYTTWPDYYHQVHKHKFASYKGFNDLKEAISFMRKPPMGDGSMETGGKTAANSRSLSSRLKSLVVEGDGGNWGNWGAGEGSSQMGTHSSGTYDGETFVDSTQEGDVLIEEDMELYLMRACTKLKVGCPSFEEVDLEVHGLFFLEEKEARQDVCFKRLDKLLSVKGKKIIDFNFRLLLAARQEVTDLRRQLATLLVQRLREVEQQRDHLQAELDKFLKWFPEQ